MAKLQSGTTGLLLSLLILAGCGASADANNAEYEKVAQRLGQYVVNGDWNGVYAMTTNEFRQAVPLEQLQASYDDLVRQMREDEPQYAANTVQVDIGVLPANEEEARQGYDIVAVPPKNTWKAWMSSGIGSGDGTTIHRGVDAWLLIVEQAGKLRIGHVNFEFID
jgi:hypothetical protein